MANFTANENFIANEVKTTLLTKKVFQDYCTVDTSLVGFDGDTKKVCTRSAIGDVQKVAEGEGNTENIEITGKYKTYTVGTYQGRFVYTDEQVGRDGFANVVGNGVTFMGEKMTNRINSDIYEEWKKTRNTIAISGNTFTFDNFVDAIASLNTEDDVVLFAFVNPRGVAKLRKQLKDDLKYVEAYVRTGYIGTVCNVNIIQSKMIEDNICIVADKEAVKVMLKDTIEAEVKREPNTRTNENFVRWVGMAYLQDEAKCVKLAPSLPTPTLNQVLANATEITGTATGATEVEVFVNDKVYEATVSNDVFSVTVPAIVSGDVLKARAYAPTKAMAESADKTI